MKFSQFYDDLINCTKKKSDPPYPDPHITDRTIFILTNIGYMQTNGDGTYRITLKGLWALHRFDTNRTVLDFMQIMDIHDSYNSNMVFRDVYLIRVKVV